MKISRVTLGQARSDVFNCGLLCSPPTRTRAVFAHILGCHDGGGRTLLLASSGKRSEKLINILQGKGHYTC